MKIEKTNITNKFNIPRKREGPRQAVLPRGVEKGARLPAGREYVAPKPVEDRGTGPVSGDDTEG